MFSVIIITAATFGAIGLAIDFFYLQNLSGPIIEARIDLWFKLFICYVLFLIPPFFMIDRDRYEKAAIAIRSFVSVSKWVSIGFLIGLGIYLSNSLIV